METILNLRYQLRTTKIKIYPQVTLIRVAFFYIQKLKGGIHMAMTNLERVKMEVGITMPDDQLSVYLEEEGLTPTDIYDSSSPVSKRKLLLTTLAILNSVANNPSYMKNYKEDNIAVSAFAENIQNRIDQIERKLRLLPTDANKNESSTFFLFNQ